MKVNFEKKEIIFIKEKCFKNTPGKIILFCFNNFFEWQMY